MGPIKPFNIGLLQTLHKRIKIRNTGSTARLNRNDAAQRISP